MNLGTRRSSWEENITIATTIIIIIINILKMSLLTPAIHIMEDSKTC
jgi:hypothetical protein